MSFHVIIPVRYDSKRLPGKPLLDLGGKPLIQRVYERVLTLEAVSIVVATDDERIQKTVEAFGATVCMTDSGHESGTERLSEAVDLLDLPDESIIVNVQGDEPFIQKKDILQVVTDLKNHPEAHMATLYTPIESPEDIFNPNCVKVVLDKEGYALYFSRAPIPWNRHKFSKSNITLESTAGYYRHIGVFAYRAGTLRRYNQLSPSPLEQLELLEQLRFLWHSDKIHATEVDSIEAHDINTEADLLKAREWFLNREVIAESI